MACAASFAGVAVRPSVRAKAVSRRSVVVVRASLADVKVGAAALAAVFLFSQAPAHASVIEDLLAKSTENKELNDRKRAATSSANFARSRTVTDKSCSFPDNFIGCQNVAEAGRVKFLSEDIALECQGKGPNACASKAPRSFPSFMGV